MSARKEVTLIFGTLRLESVVNRSLMFNNVSPSSFSRGKIHDVRIIGRRGKVAKCGKNNVAG